VIVGIGVLLDTLLVRTVLVPALATLTGDRFWWPGRPQAVAEGDEGEAGKAEARADWDAVNRAKIAESAGDTNR
jgi:RND superfamily putative drug exporter